MKKYPLSFIRIRRVTLLCFMLISASVAIVGAPLKKSVALTFTSEKTCFVGFSTKDVTNCVKLAPNERFTEPGGANPVVFHFYPYDPIISTKPTDSPGVYISDVFYAYCQSFSRKPLKVTIKAPANLKNLNSKSNTINYEMIYIDSIKTATSQEWSVNNSVEVSEVAPPGGEFSEARVIISQPIMMRVKSTDVKANTTYEGTFKITVSTVV